MSRRALNLALDRTVREDIVATAAKIARLRADIPIYEAALEAAERKLTNTLVQFECRQADEDEVKPGGASSPTAHNDVLPAQGEQQVPLAVGSHAVDGAAVPECQPTLSSECT